jgi:hypothetical protein
MAHLEGITMDRLSKEVLERIEIEMKRQKITKKSLARMLGRKESWLHSIFSLRRQLKAGDFLKMLAVLKVPCEKVLPPKLGAEIGTLELSEYFSRLVNKEIEFYMQNQVKKPHGRVKGTLSEY